MSEIQSLIATGDAAMQALAQQIEQVRRVVDHEHASALQLQQRLEKTYEAVHKASDGLEAHLQALEAVLLAEGDQSLEQLAHVEARASEMEDKLDELMTEFHEQMGQLHGKIKEIYAEVDGAFKVAAASFDTLQQHSKTITAELAAEQDAIIHKQEHLHEAVLAAMAEVATGKQALEDGLESCEQHLTQQAQEMTQEFSTATHAVGERASALEQAVEQAQEQAEAKIKQAVQEDLGHHLDEAQKEIGEAFGGVVDAVGEGAASIKSGGGELIGKMEGVVSVVEAIKPVLDMVQTVLG